MLRRKLHVRLAALAASVAAVTVPTAVVTVASANPAAADQTSDYLLSSTTNTSDPDVEPCTFNGTSGYCMYTSNDLGSASQNVYPMNATLGWFSPTGLDGSWQSEGTVFTEQQYVNVGWTPAGANHLWAPAMTFSGGFYWLYVPDITNVNDPSHTSYIGVSYASSPFGPFTPYARIFGSGGSYASDPDVLHDPVSATNYLIYANGDFSTCGTLSEATMPSSNLPTWYSSTQPISISGIGAALGTCGGGSQPYEEGASLYYTANWGAGVPGPYLLEFAAKPNFTPSGCESDAGEPGTANEVIAYATAPTATGPFTYQGILMCGSSSEWTDQASLLPVRTPSGTAIAMYYHDGPSGLPNRKVHGTCLMFGNGSFAAAMRPVYIPSGPYAGLVEPNFAQCGWGNYSDLWAFQSEAPGQVNPHVVTTDLGTSGTPLNASSRIAPNAYEWYRVVDARSGQVVSVANNTFGSSASVQLLSWATGQYVNLEWGLSVNATEAANNPSPLNMNFGIHQSGNGFAVDIDGTFVANNGWLESELNPPPFTQRPPATLFNALSYYTN